MPKTDTAVPSDAAILRDVAQLLDNEGYELTAKGILRDYLASRAPRLRTLADVLAGFTINDITTIEVSADLVVGTHPQFAVRLSDLAKKIRALLPPE